MEKILLKVFSEFIEMVSKAMNSTFITLIPKKIGTKCVSDYRPISLVSRTHKILSKVLSNRLKEVLSDIIDGDQCAFIKINKSWTVCVWPMSV